VLCRNTGSTSLKTPIGLSPMGVSKDQSMQDEAPKIVDSLANQSREAAKDILFGSIAGVIGKAIEYPFDTVKVRLQAQASTRPLTYSGPLDCFRQSIRQDGFWGLYRGISPPLFGAAVETSSLFFSVCSIKL
jgi:ornithine carrier protein